jgi:hypothetical protein
MAAESQHGFSSGLQCVPSTSGEVLSDPEAVQREIFSFYEAISQGHHAAAIGADAQWTPASSSCLMSLSLTAF